MMYDEPEDDSYISLVWQSVRDLLSVVGFVTLIVVVAFFLGYSA